jgi:hypothetical protein
MNKLIICFIFTLFVSIKSKLLEKNSICTTLKSELYSAASYYKRLDHHLKNELFDQSMRPLAYEIILSAKLDRQHVPQAKKLIDEIKVLMNDLTYRHSYSKQQIDKALEVQTANNSKWLEDINFWSEKEESLRAEVIKIHNGLKMLSQKLNTSGQIKSYLDVALQAEVLQMKVNNDLGMNLNDSSTLTEMRNLFQITQSNALALNNMVEAKMEYETLKLHLGNYEQLDRFIHFSKHEQALYQAMVITRDEMQSKYQTAKGQAYKVLETIQNTYSQALKANELYMQYFNTIKMAKERMDYQKSCSASSLRAQHEVKETQRLIGMFSNKQARVTPEEILMLTEEIESLENVIESIKDQHQINYVHENATLERIRLLKDGMNTTHLPQVQQRLNGLKATKQKIITILTKERALDELLGEIVAELQNNHNPSKFEICMSNHEFAIFLYYMSLTGFVSSNRTFLNSFLTHLTPDNQVNVARQIYIVFIQREAVDTQFIDPDTETFTPDMKDNLVKMYTDMMKVELNKVFETQMAHLRNPSFMMMMLDSMGLDGYNVLEGILEVGYEHYFGQLASALMAVLGLTVSLGIGISILTVFLVWLSNKAVQEMIRICREDELPLYKASFYDHMTKVYKYLFMEETYSLNYIEYLNDGVKNQTVSLKEIVRYPNGTIHSNIFNILDSIYTGSDFFVSTRITSRRARIVI